MFGRASHNKLSDRQRFRLEVASAVARERIFEVHVAHARELVRILEGRMLASVALKRYARRQRLSRQESALLRSRILSGLAETFDDAVAGSEAAVTGPAAAGAGSEATETGHDAEPEAAGAGTSVDEILELAGGRAKAAILHCHVRNALDFVELLDGILTQRQAAIVYSETVGLLRPWVEVVYDLCLGRRAEDRLPEPVPGFPILAAPARDTLTKRDHPPSRSVGGRRGGGRRPVKPVAVGAAQERA